MSNCFTQACAAAFLAFALLTSSTAPGAAEGVRPAVSTSGIITTKSVYGLQETVDRLKKDVAAKGITFGNPPLGTQFMTANPQAGLDWPVRLLVYRDASGTVWTAYTDFAWIAKRHGVQSRDAQFHMASEVAASIVSSVAAH
jgi:uncharacterized protein (DUF302 family)